MISSDLDKRRKKKERPMDKAGAVIVCTMERASNILKILLSEKRMEEISLVVIDEFHMLNEENRGSTLELLVTKTLYHNKSCSEGGKIRVIGMSATIPNLSDFSNWLGGSLFYSNHRPVPLREYYYDHNEKKLVEPYFDHMRVGKRRTLKTYSPKEVKEYRDVKFGHLVVETLGQGGSVLIFCGYRSGCLKTARILCDMIDKRLLALPEETLTSQPRRRKRNKTDSMMELEDEDEGESDEEEEDIVLDENLEAIKSRAEALHQLDDLPFKSDLFELVKLGIGFHHAGLSKDEKEIVEKAYFRGGIRVLACTTTLAVGVNLPARRVIFKSIRRFRNEVIPKLSYKQAAGRAGRKGKDLFGESIVVVGGATELGNARKMILHDESDITLLSVKSQLGGDNMRQALLEIINAKSANSYHLRKRNATYATENDMRDFIECTFFFYMKNKNPANRMYQWRMSFSHSVSAEVENLRNIFEESLAWLRENELVSRDRSRFSPGKPGRAIFNSCLRVESGVRLVKELQNVRQNGFVMDPKFHVLYIICCADDGMKYMLRLRGEKSMVRQELEKDVYRETLNRIDVTSDEFYADKYGAKLTRVFKALLLNEVLEEKSVSEVAKKYECMTGDVQSYRKEVVRLSEVVKHVCECLGWVGILASVKQVRDCLRLKVRESLVKICKSITSLPTYLAKLLQDKCDFRNVIDYAMVDPVDLAHEIEKVKSHKHNRLKRKRLEGNPNKKLAEDIVVEARSHFDESQLPYLTPTPSLVDFPYFKDACRMEEKYPYRVNLIKDKDSCMKFTEAVMKLSPEIISVRVVLYDAVRIDDFRKGELRGLVIFLPELGKGRGIFYLDICQFFEEKGVVKHLWDGVMRNPDIQKVCYRMKENIFFLQGLNLIQGTVHDPIVIKWLLADDDKDYSNEKFSDVYSRSKAKFDDMPVLPPGKGENEYNLQQSVKIAVESYYLFKTLKKRFDRKDLKKLFALYVDIETKVTKILGEMKLRGIRYLPSKVVSIKEQLTARKKIARESIFELAGQEFDINSSGKVREVLFTFMNLKPPRDGKGRIVKGANKKVLEDAKNINCRDHRSIIFDLIIQYRSLATVLRGYSWADRDINDDERKNVGAYRNCEWVQVSSSTGRIMGELQNTKKNFISYKSQSQEHMLSPRGVYCVETDRCLLSFDYQALEFRIIAHFSGDETLEGIFSIEHVDIFESLAKCVQDATGSHVTRSQVKALAYGIIYGMGEQAIQKSLNLSSKTEASDLKQKFMNTFPGLKRYIEEVHLECEQSQILETGLGRRRLFKMSTNFDMSKKKRCYLNTKIQATASDIFKVSLVKVMDKLKNGVDRDLWEIKDYSLVCVLHDELIFDVCGDLVNDISQTIKNTMENAYREIPGLRNLRIPVREKRGPNWGSMRLYK